jgi:hypothetical protein
MKLCVNGPAFLCGEICNQDIVCTEARHIVERPRLPVVIYTNI